MLREVWQEAELEEALTAAIAVVFKHSPYCGASRWAREEVVDFAESHPDTPVFQIDVITARELSQNLARRLGIPHQSPQVIVLRSGEPIWNDSHSRVQKEALELAIQKVSGT